MIVCVYLIVINVVGFASMGIDKRKAIRHEWRISEAALFIMALIGGSAGCIAGMRVFRHKTKHRSFTIGMPCILIAQIVAAVMYYYMNFSG